MEVVYIRDLLIIYREYDHIQIVYTFEPFSFLFTTYLPRVRCTDVLVVPNAVNLSKSM